ncbi:M50 family metallopeptidase [Halolamina sediminis]|jgi:hypothetical protein|uniref:M50 family metallopeptidase n=1 Tax=Halolamina sediminis TaxID=1480675 RepID=UPI0006B63588|nr:M50 family metallopeptidase [Halolamina sediminis]
MDSVSTPAVVVLCVLLYVGVLPALVAVHELGHAAVALAVTDGSVGIVLGTEADREWTVGRLTIGVSALSGWVGFYRAAGEMTLRQRTLCSFTGPLTSLSVCLVALVTLRSVDVSPVSELLVTGVALGAGWQFVVTAVPVRYPDWWSSAYAGRPSDGYRTVRSLRKLLGS